jgi:5-amino-6-(5-phosphoribosylamino)uracil reductase/diaminohydroxyphosphoribosylaminopyrimidine deaminase/5-amino-6-(5-phosphoribosylamino)uracil reductase
VLSPGRVVVIGARPRAIDEERAWLASRGAAVEVVGATTDGLVALDEALDALAARGVRRLLVEGGARVVTSFLRARLVDRLHVEIATRILGAPGTVAIGALGVRTLDAAPRLANVSVERCGENMLLRGDVVHD